LILGKSGKINQNKMEGKKCRLIFHGKTREIDMGIFESISSAKKYVKDCWDGPYTIINL
jgi:rRNA processing protein Krr1/Pno1